MTKGRLFQFEGIDANLDLIPLAARRLLDHVGAKLSLQGWRSLSADDRHTLVRLGSADVIDEAAAREVLARATPEPKVAERSSDPEEAALPELQSLLGEPRARTLLPPAWSQLEPLERWVLWKLGQSKNPERLSLGYDEIVRPRLSHVSPAGEARMVATTDKPLTLRRAVATSRVTLSPEAHRCLVMGNTPKGEVLGTARVAGILAAKQTSQLIPLCHPLHLTQVDLQFSVLEDPPAVDLRADVVAVDRTGVEMEALTAVSVAALTIYDMLKAVDRDMAIGPTRLLEKSGGKSGEYSG